MQRSRDWRKVPDETCYDDDEETGVDGWGSTNNHDTGKGAREYHGALFVLYLEVEQLKLSPRRRCLNADSICP